MIRVWGCIAICRYLRLGTWINENLKIEKIWEKAATYNRALTDHPSCTFILSFARPHLIAEAEPLGQIAGPSRNPSTPERQNTRKANWQSSGDGNTKCQRKGETLELLCFKLFGVLTFESWPLSFSHLSFDFAYPLHFLGLRSKEDFIQSLLRSIPNIWRKISKRHFS